MPRPDLPLRVLGEFLIQRSNELEASSAAAAGATEEGKDDGMKDAEQ